VERDHRKVLEVKAQRPGYTADFESRLKPDKREEWGAAPPEIGANLLTAWWMGGSKGGV